MSKGKEIDPTIINQIVQGTYIKGDIVSDKSFRMEGTLDGNLSTKGRLVIGKDGVVNGNIYCEEGDIEGTINGMIVIQGLLSLRPTAVLNTETYTRQLKVEPGAVLNGSIDMSGKNMPISEAFKTDEGTKKGEKSNK